MKIVNRMILAVGAVASLLLGACTDKANGANSAAEVTAQAVNDIEQVAETSAVTTVTGNRLPDAKGKMAVLDFNATWCAPCRKFAPNFEAVASRMRAQANFYSVDVDKNPQLAAQFGVQSVPTVVYLLPDGRYFTTTGYLDEAEFLNRVNTALRK